MWKKSWTKQTLALGIETDAKVGRNNSYAIMRFNGVDREVLLDCPEDDIQDLPKWLTPVKTSMKFLDMRAGGRTEPSPVQLYSDTSKRGLHQRRSP